MSPVAAPTLTPLPESPFLAELTSLATAPSNVDAKSIADGIALSLKKSPRVLEAIQEARIIDVVLIWSGSKSGYERESAPVLVERICKSLGAGVESAFLPLLPALLSLAMDKGQPVRTAVTSAVNALIKAAPVEGSRMILDTLCKTLEEAKGWRSKVAALKAIEGLVKPGAEEWVAVELGHVIPFVEHAMHDTKAEVSAAANKAATTLCGTLPNPDVLKHINLLVSAMASPNAVAGTIKALSSTTFVAEVNAPTLAVMVPLLSRALKERSTDTQRMTCIVIGNLVKLVRDPTVAARYLGPLVGGVQQLAEGAAFPEIRAFAQTALDILISAGASATATPLPPRDIILSVTEALTVMVPHLKGVPGLPSHPSIPLSASLPGSPVLAHSIEYEANIVADLVDLRRWDADVWEGKAVGSFMKLLMGAEDGAAATQAIRKAFMDIDRAKYAPATEDDGSEGQLLCDIQFSLAYGGLLLLNHTNLKLRRGRRYGICAGNGAGKSTLMKAIRDGKVEGFPSQDELRCLMVEHALQGEDTSMTIVDFVASDPKLKDRKREEIAAMLLSVGFSEEKQRDPVASLSGGWKMKLELARAMLIGADILLLDEPTNHLDVQTVGWLEQYLCDLSEITCLIVSHDSGFLDNVCTDIMHYEDKKIVYYPGNLSKFVEKVPRPNPTTPSPRPLSSSRSPSGLAHGRPVKHPGHHEAQQLHLHLPWHVSPLAEKRLVSPLPLLPRGNRGAQWSWQVNPNQASDGRDGSARGHGAQAPGAPSWLRRPARVPPHQPALGQDCGAVHDGHDREMLEKATRVLTDEDKEMMDRPIEGKNGELRKIEYILGRSKLKKGFQYEVKFKGLDHKHNAWIPRDVLVAKGFTKLLGQFDDMESSREGAGMRDTSASAVREVLEAVGLNGDIAQYNEMSGLSGGQKVKVVIAAAMFNRPQCLFLDEPTNFLDREALGGLAVAIKEWGGAVCIISHSTEFVTALCPEIWHVDAGELTQKGKVVLVEDAFDDPSRPASRTTSKAGTPRGALSKVGTPANGTPAGSAATSAANSGAEDAADGLAKLALKPKKKKKLTRNEVKAQEERRRLRKLNWLTYGGEREPDTDDDE
ncbi:hypothetical protein EHS25_006145 [Saitozyma podzolica]|uniref:Elongation factor 3 n=1 Tax=Saitozyma podzolica TaxID=1890683 RepID=A0A427XRS6_9TREE|nr:hypothetical protein EHS25_006145 [Saitozyma podzolica]